MLQLRAQLITVRRTGGSAPALLSQRFVWAASDRIVSTTPPFLLDTLRWGKRRRHSTSVGSEEYLIEKLVGRSSCAASQSSRKSAGKDTPWKRISPAITSWPFVGHCIVRMRDGFAPPAERAVGSLDVLRSPVGILSLLDSAVSENLPTPCVAERPMIWSGTS